MCFNSFIFTLGIEAFYWFIKIEEWVPRRPQFVAKFYHHQIPFQPKLLGVGGVDGAGVHGFGF